MNDSNYTKSIYLTRSWWSGEITELIWCNNLQTKSLDKNFVAPQPHPYYSFLWSSMYIDLYKSSKKSNQLIFRTVLKYFDGLCPICQMKWNLVLSFSNWCPSRDVRYEPVEFSGIAGRREFRFFVLSLQFHGAPSDPIICQCIHGTWSQVTIVLVENDR